MKNSTKLFKFWINESNLFSGFKNSDEIEEKVWDYKRFLI